jgi:hypothetical protein
MQFLIIHRLRSTRTVAGDWLTLESYSLQKTHITTEAQRHRGAFPRKADPDYCAPASWLRLLCDSLTLW